MENFIYEQHPVSVERKKELVERGYTILDAQFAPEGYVHPDKKSEEPVVKSTPKRKTTVKTEGF